MKVGGENPRKVFNIVYKQANEFRRIYNPVVDEVAHVEFIREGKLRVSPYVVDNLTDKNGYCYIFERNNF
jgi:hypothetical protein